MTTIDPDFYANLEVKLDECPTYLDKLNYLLDRPIEQLLIGNNSAWNSLVINRRKPYTYRVSRMIGKYRLCLHKFEECEESEAFLHPHPWPAAFQILSGDYLMNVGFSRNLTDAPEVVMRQLQVEGSQYEIVEPRTWHSVTPQGGVVYTMMLNGPPWIPGEHHEDVRTTKGKDLQTMTPAELKQFLQDYRRAYNG